MKDDRRSRQHSLLVRIHRLSMRSDRDRQGLYYAEGVRAVLQALDAHLPVDTLVHSETLLTNPVAQKRVRLARRAGMPAVRVTPGEFRSVSNTERASGIGAILRQHWTPLAQADPLQGLCWIALRSLRAAGNLGSIMRTAEAVGAAGLILLGDDADPFDPAVLRASMGGLFRLRMVRTTLESFGEWARIHGCRVIGTSPSADTNYTAMPVEPPLVIMFGDERTGLSAEERAVCTHLARIPLLGCADSLNVGVAAGIVLYEVVRRREAGSLAAPAY